MTNEEKAKEIAKHNDGYIDIIAFGSAKIMAEWKDKQYQPLVNTCKDLISVLQISRAYHLGITALDNHEERERKEREGNTALIRSIDEEIEYANEIINEFIKKD